MVGNLGRCRGTHARSNDWTYSSGVQGGGCPTYFARIHAFDKHFCGVDDLFKLVNTNRFTAALDQRLRLAEGIFRQIEPKLRAFVFGAVNPNAAPDVLQEVPMAVAGSLRNFNTVRT